MKGKRILSTCLVAMLIFSMAIFAPGASAGSTAVVRVDPSTVEYETAVPCQYNNTYFWIEVKVDNVTDLYGYNVYLEYNATLLTKNQTKVTGTGQVVPPETANYTFYDTSVSGEVQIVVAFLENMGALSFNGSGTLVWIQFKIIYCPAQLMDVDNEVNCSLTLDPTWTLLKDSLAGDIDRTLQDGFYSYTTKGLVTGAPTADFTWTPTFPFECTDVTLTDTSSPGANATIVSWKWTLTNGTGSAHLTGPDDASQTTFHCDGAGTIYVDLNVTNNVGKWNNITKEITQLAVVGALLDLYSSDNRFCGQITTKVGIGLGDPCDALTPDVNVTLFAKVTWGGAPVAHVLVAFEVFDNHTGQPVNILSRTAETDKEGIARIWFRVPRPNPPESIFGKWFAFAKAKIQDDFIEDTMPFDVGYLIDIIDVEVYPTEVYRGTDRLLVTIYLKNIALITKHYVLVVTLYDDCDVPIGKFWVAKNITAGVWCDPAEDIVEILSNIIPDWAYVGVGKVYVSVFTDWPRECGVPYSPEEPDAFMITWSP